MNGVADHIVLPLKRFLVVPACPPEWRGFDLYLFRDGEVVFYVGQSYLAYDRVWQHITDGYKARSVVGRFILCNWPGSMRFTIELWSSQADRFAAIDHDLNAAERSLIEQYAPCFNEALNRQPTPLPDRYAPPSAPIRCSRSPNKLIHEAERAVQADERRAWLIV
jgi:hypothetical protein